MTSITLSDYLMGREKSHSVELSTETLANARRTTEILNKLFRALDEHRVPLETHPAHKSYLSSGWRPPSYNATVPGAALRSLHMTGEAGDIYDPDGLVDDFLMSEKGQGVLTALGLWMEHPSATKGWSHVQTKPPKSGRRVFYP